MGSQGLLQCWVLAGPTLQLKCIKATQLGNEGLGEERYQEGTGPTLCASAHANHVPEKMVLRMAQVTWESVVYHQTLGFTEVFLAFLCEEYHSDFR